MKTLIFAYGSNMNAQHLQEFAKSKYNYSFNWQKVCNARLPNYTIAWNRFSNRWGGGVANIAEKENEEVWGVILSVSEKDLAILDQKESYPNVYQRYKVEVFAENGEKYEVETYKAPADERTLYFLPTYEYLKTIIEGAEINNLPEAYLQKMKETPVCKIEKDSTLPNIAIYGGRGVVINTQKHWNKLFENFEIGNLYVLYSHEFNYENFSKFDLIILPGGSGQKICGGIGDRGKIELRDYIKNGGKILGVCAGAYALTQQLQDYIWLSPLKIQDFPFTKRGEAIIPVEFSETGIKMFEAENPVAEVIFHNGPIVNEYPLKQASNLQYLGYFRREIVQQGGKEGLMLNSPMAWINQYGKGWVLGISPHFERTEGLEKYIANLIGNLLKM